MTMFHLERGLRKSKDPRDQERADTVAAMLKDRGEDIALPQSELRTRRPLTAEEKEALRREGLTAVYPLTEETIADQRKKGRKFWYVTGSDNNSLLIVRSLIGDVAVDPRPDKFFLPKSNKLTLDRQLEMVSEFSYKLQRKLKTDSIEAILGQAPDYTELAFAHLDAVGERFFGQNYGYNYARTQTPTVGSSVANVGSFGAGGGLVVRGLHRGYGLVSVFAVPLVVAK